jgi:hypothetical protein
MRGMVIQLVAERLGRLVGLESYESLDAGTLRV